MLAGAAAAEAQTQYLPLDTGNVWIYRNELGLGASTLQVEVVRKETFGGREYALVAGLAEGGAWLRFADDGKLVSYNPDTKVESLWIDFNAPAERRFPSTIDQCVGWGAITSREAKYQGPIGEFSNMLEVTYTPSGCADAGIVRDLFLPNVGLVERSMQTIAGPRPLALIYARLGGVTVISESHVAFGLALDRPVYTANRMMPVDLQRAIPVMTARLTLRNSGSLPLELTFPSGQTYDFVIRNERGVVVYQWSADKSFIAALRNETLAGGEKNWMVIVPLAVEGRPLPEGKYIAEAWLTTSREKAYSATTAFEVKHVF